MKIAGGAVAVVALLLYATPLGLAVRMVGENPAAAEAQGIDHVFCNGVEIVRHGGFTPARPGTVLRSGRDTADPALD